MMDQTSRVHHKLPDAWEPVIYSRKIDDAVHDNVIFKNVFNHDYEGELKGIGSKLVIRSWPELKANDYVLDTPINPQRIDATAREVTVGKAWEISLVLDQWDLMWSDMKAWERMRSQKIAVTAAEFLEDKWFGQAPGLLTAGTNPFAAWNTGNSAGINGDIKLGTATDPIWLAPEKNPTAIGSAKLKNVLKHFYDIDMVHTRHRGASSATGKYIITVPEVLKVLREFDAFERSPCAEPLDALLRKDVAKVGTLAVTGFDVYVSNRLTPSGTDTESTETRTVYPMFFGDTRAWTYADLVSETGVKEDPKIPGVSYEYHIGGYDWWLCDPQYAGLSYVAV